VSWQENLIEGRGEARRWRLEGAYQTARHHTTPQDTILCAELDRRQHSHVTALDHYDADTDADYFTETERSDSGTEDSDLEYPRPTLPVEHDGVFNVVSGVAHHCERCVLPAWNLDQNQEWASQTAHLSERRKGISKGKNSSPHRHRHSRNFALRHTAPHHTTPHST
jgi:hypothetical protein